MARKVVPIPKYIELLSPSIQGGNDETKSIFSCVYFSQEYQAPVATPSRILSRLRLSKPLIIKIK